MQVSDIEGNIVLMARALADLEVNFPSAEQGILRHQLLHLAESQQISGPVWTTAMWAYERLWGRVTKWMKQPAHPEANMMHAYVALQTAHFL